MQMNIISKTEMGNMRSTVNYPQEFITGIQNFLNNGNKTEVLHIVMNDNMGTERQRIRKLVGLHPTFKALSFSMKNLEKVCNLFITFKEKKPVKPTVKA